MELIRRCSKLAVRTWLMTYWISVLTSLSFTMLSVTHSFIIMIGVKPHRVNEARKATWSSSVLDFGIFSV